MKRHSLWFLALLILALGAIACGQVPTEPPAGGITTQSTPILKPTEVASPKEAQSLVDQVIADAVQTAQVTKSEIEVLKVEPMQWPSSCLGCEQKGQMCLDVITPGYLIVLLVGSEEYSYHTDTKDTFIRCVTDDTEMRDWGEAQPFVDKVIADLIDRLSTSKEEITVVRVEKKMWPDSSIGCPQPGQMYLQVVTPGYQVVLEAGGQEYDYHMDERGNFVLCQK